MGWDPDPPGGGPIIRQLGPLKLILVRSGVPTIGMAWSKTPGYSHVIAIDLWHLTFCVEFTNRKHYGYDWE